MKTKTHILILVITSVFTVMACKDSKAKHSDAQIEEISARTQFPDTVDPAEKTTFDFENYTAGELPSEWSEYHTGSGDTEWKIVDDNGNKVLAQLYSDNPNNHFNVVVNNNITAKDMVLTARFKGITGNHDQGGGFVWRFTDKNNYYIVRANPLEDNMVLYKVENGKRTDLPLVGKGRTYGTDVSPLGNSWHTMKLVVKEDLFTVYLDDKKLFTVQDTTFVSTGKVGFWTKADAVTYFDDFEIEKFNE
ncbi:MULTISPECIES: hypothetical protein [unclassified Arenibacter]|uniref:hypothetical protein n=1 Tax=unclassified Arenibacter TaxID=2615047 RepID=UPI000E34A7CA|nr:MULTISPECIES: hypothetical protein [unclassified Arenibacter]MCM4163622.1 hypothetical protein [Arenibacter sp. A80]RFT56350.1 hypothetical protein D0S24_08425 [Arenibacter sp. P308M17]